jgi:hypothetical protein
LEQVIKEFRGPRGANIPSVLQTPALQTPILQTPLMARISVLFVCLLGSWGNPNGIISSNIYRNGPKFTAGHSTVMTYMLSAAWWQHRYAHLACERE